MEGLRCGGSLWAEEAWEIEGPFLCLGVGKLQKTFLFNTFLRRSCFFSFLFIKSFFRAVLGSQENRGQEQSPHTPRAPGRRPPWRGPPRRATAAEPTAAAPGAARLTGLGTRVVPRTHHACRVLSRAVVSQP